MKIFTHARQDMTVHDPVGAIAAGHQQGRFDVDCSLPQDDPAVTGALQAHGTMPVAGVRWLGLATGQLVLAIMSVVMVLLGLVLVAVSSGPSETPGRVAGVVIAVLGAAVGVLTVISARRRRVGMHALANAWQHGWLRFAPAEVGGVWIAREVVHGREHPQGVNQDHRYWYCAEVRVHPADGTEPFTFITRPFEALGDRDGNPHDLRTAPGVVDAFEPEYANGWTIVRYIAGDPQDREASATVTTNLSDDQVRAALEAADRGGL